MCIYPLTPTGVSAAEITSGPISSLPLLQRSTVSVFGKSITLTLSMERAQISSDHLLPETDI